MSLNPIARFNRCYRRAFASGAPLPDAMALATADERGRPAVRYVLLKRADGRGFVFYTSLGSRKGRELLANPHASLAFYWDAIGTQVRVEGRIELVSSPEADAYWATRPRESQLAATVSRQSQVIASHRLLVQRWERLCRDMAGQAVPRPENWTGLRLLPRRIEFWTRGAHRLHRRERYTRTRAGWKKESLQP